MYERPDRIGLIWAQTPDGVIGVGGDMPWHLPEDLRHFRQVTRGHAVIMGRKTWESFPERYRPLPDRTNIVISRDLAYEAPGAIMAKSLDDALAIAHDEHPYDMAWVIGGGRVYAEAIGIADELEVTEIDVDVHGDTFAPKIDDTWELTSVEPVDGWSECGNGARVRWMTFTRDDRDELPD